jgi:hypothetical protein
VASAHSLRCSIRHSRASIDPAGGGGGGQARRVGRAGERLGVDRLSGDGAAGGGGGGQARRVGRAGERLGVDRLSGDGAEVAVGLAA